MRLSELDDEQLKHIDKVLKIKKTRQQLEKDAFDLEVRKGNVTKIDTATSIINNLVNIFVAQLDSIPSEIQSIVPTIKPEQYSHIVDLIEGYKKVLGKTAVDLSFDGVGSVKTLDPSVEHGANAHKKASKK